MATTAQRRDTNRAFWASAAPGWIRHADRQDRVGEPLGAGALAALAPATGDRIADIGCAAGGTTSAIAAAVGPTGTAVGVDLSEEMIDAARRRFPDVRFVAADVETLDVLPGAPFDKAYARMSLMLFADPVAGCAAVRRSLRPGGRLAASVFRGADVNPWLGAVVLGAAPHVGALPPLPMGDEPGPFAWADRDRIVAVLGAAGFVDVTVTGEDVEIAAPDDPDSVAEWIIEVGPAGGPYRASDAPARAAARAGVTRLLSRFHRPGDGYRLPSGVWTITATAGASPR